MKARHWTALRVQNNEAIKSKCSQILMKSFESNKVSSKFPPPQQSCKGAVRRAEAETEN